MKALLPRIACAASWGYLGSLAGLVLLLRFVGERSWITQILLYLPRPLFGLPLLVLVPLCLHLGSRRLLAANLFSLLVVLFPLCGLVLSPAALLRGAPKGPSLRVLSYNVWFGRRGNDIIRAEIERHRPDIVLFQAGAHRTNEYFREYFRGWNLHIVSEFLMATRFPVKEIHEPKGLWADRHVRDAYVRYTLETPLGLLDVMNVHPFSPRKGFELARGPGILASLRSGRSIAADSAERIETDTETRHRQVRLIAEAAAASGRPVIIAGDTNLPELSWLFGRYLSRFRDGFSEAGLGFGYTYPAHRIPWLRLDRILTSKGLSFRSFKVGSFAGSDHAPVIADIELEN